MDSGIDSNIDIAGDIGIIGLGNMGAGIAANLQRWCTDNARRLWVLDLDADKMRALTDKGAFAASSAADIAGKSQILFTSLPSANQVDQLAHGDQNEQGILAHLPNGAVWLETSTNESARWEKIRTHARASLHLVDAPISGGAEGAAAGTLAMFLGIDEKLHARLTPMLDCIAAKHMRMGPPGAGYVTKLVQLHLNYLVAQGIGEALMLGAKADIDLAQLYEVLMHSCAKSYVVERYIPMVLDGGYDPSFTLGLAQKDMRLISKLGEHLDVELKLGDAVYAEYQTAVASYGEDSPHLKIVSLLEDKCGRKLR